jgi:hypothetical protein
MSAGLDRVICCSPMADCAHHAIVLLTDVVKYDNLTVGMSGTVNKE